MQWRLSERMQLPTLQDRAQEDLCGRILRRRHACHLRRQVRRCAHCRCGQFPTQRSTGKHLPKWRRPQLLPLLAAVLAHAQISHAELFDVDAFVYQGNGAAKGASHLPLLGHFCSIITSLAVSPDGRCIVSTDKDHKVRVSLLPAVPLQVREVAVSIEECVLSHVKQGILEAYM